MDSISEQNKKKKTLFFLFILILFLSFLFSILFLIYESRKFKLKEKRVYKKIYKFNYITEFQFPYQYEKFKKYKDLLKNGKKRKAYKVFQTITFPPSLSDYQFKENLKILAFLKKDRKIMRNCTKIKDYYLSPFYYDILKTCATTYRENKRWKNLEKLLNENERILSLQTPLFYLFLKGEILKHKYGKGKRKAQDLFKKILINYPFSEYEKPIKKIYPRLLRKLTNEEKLKRIENLIKKRKLRIARAELYKVKDCEKKEYLIGLSYYKRRLFSFARKWFKKVDPASESGVIACKYLLRISYKRSKLLKIDNIYNECIRAGANRDSLREIMGDFYFSNLILFRAKHFYEKAIKSGVPLIQRNEIKRRLAWVNFVLGEKEKTFDYYKNKHLYPKNEPSASDEYWYAKLKEELFGKDKETKEIYRKIAKNYYYHYYGQLAFKKLSRKDKKKIEQMIEHRTLDLSYTPFIISEFKRLDFFSKNNLISEFMKELEYFSLLYSSEELKYYYLDELKRLDNLYFIIRKRLDLKYPYSVTTPVKYLYFAYPLPSEYFMLIERESSRYGVDPYLTISLIRQESLFNEEAISYAGARGLMQLMYYTARRLAKELNMRKVYKRHLYIPQTNIKLGVYYLKKLFDRYGKDNYIYVLASYNAGEHRVDYWDKILRNLNKDEFVEMIPFTQTRKYVKIILTNYFIYRKIYTAE